MLFKPKPATPPIPSQQMTLQRAWARAAGPAQQFWINVTSWNYKVFPELRGRGQPTFHFNFEGTVANRERENPLVGLTVAGDVEVVTLEDTAGGMPDHWKTTPEFMQGWGDLMEEHESDGLAGMQPLVGVTLYVNEQTFDWVYRAFSVGHFSRKGGLSIEVTIDCPDADGDDFWVERWREKRWRVARWGLFAGARSHKAD